MSSRYLCVFDAAERGGAKEGGRVDSVTDLNTRWINRSPVCCESVPSVELTPGGFEPR